MDYKALNQAAEAIRAKSNEIGDGLARRFDERQRTFEVESNQLKPSGDQMNVAFNL